MSTALQKAMSGEKIPEGKKNSILNEALDKVKSLGGRMAKAREMSESVADAVIATAETQGTVFMASFAEGYWGEGKMDVGPLDLRVAGGLVLGGYGLYQTISGKGGSHSLAIGNGMLATGIGRIGRSAGRAMAEKQAEGSAPPPAASAPQPAAAPAVKGDDFGAIARMIAGPPAIHTAGDDIGEIARMVRMTPGTEGEDVAGRRSRAPRHGRFLRTRN